MGGKNETWTRSDRIVVGALVGLFVVLLVRTAWLCDDAYITFRTIDNLIDGYGLRWNPIERVQSFTHPLWLLFLTPFVFLSGEVYYTTILLSILVSSAAVLLAVFATARGTGSAALVVGVCFFSRAFVDYSTSGLENPMTHLLLAIFVGLFFQARQSPGRFFLFLLTGTLGVLNRLDTALLFGPAALWILWQAEFPWKRKLLLALAAGSPLLFWEIFSLVYYGFPFPNTAYAKLNNGLSTTELLPQGFRYVADSARHDPLTLAAILVGLIVTLVPGKRHLAPFGIGILLYLLYVLKIGGDFMSGRFFTPPLFLAALLIARLPVKLRSFKTAGAGIPIVVLGMLAFKPTVLVGGDYPLRELRESGISDERSFYHHMTWLWGAKPGSPHPDLPYRFYRPLSHHAPVTFQQGAVGFIGYHAGPRVTIVDDNALGDALLARLPPYHDEDWRIGHFQRLIPPGYIDTVDQGRNLLDDPQLAELRNRLRLVTQGPVWSAERFAEIVRFNLGKNEHLVDEQKYRHPLPELARQAEYERRLRWRLRYEAISKPETASEAWNGRSPYLGGPGYGIRISMGEETVAQTAEVRATEAHDLRLDFFLGEKETGSLVVPPVGTDHERLATRRINLPDSIAGKPFDRVEVYQLKSNNWPAVLGHLRFE